MSGQSQISKQRATWGPRPAPPLVIPPLPGGGRAHFGNHCYTASDGKVMIWKNAVVAESKYYPRGTEEISKKPVRITGVPAENFPNTSTDSYLYTKMFCFNGLLRSSGICSPAVLRQPQVSGSRSKPRKKPAEALGNLGIYTV
jgi:hypothetical protein